MKILLKQLSAICSTHDYINSGYTFAEANTAAWTSDGTTATTTVAGPLAAGESVTIEILLTVTPDADPSIEDYYNYAEITSAADSEGALTIDVDSEAGSNNAAENSLQPGEYY